MYQLERRAAQSVIACMAVRGADVDVGCMPDCSDSVHAWPVWGHKPRAQTHPGRATQRDPRHGAKLVHRLGLGDAQGLYAHIAIFKLR